MKDSFTLGSYTCLIIITINLSAFIIKTCILDKGFNKNNRSITIYWLFCLKISNLTEYQIEKKKKVAKKQFIEEKIISGDK